MQRAQQLRADIVVHVAIDALAFLFGPGLVSTAAFDELRRHLQHVGHPRGILCREQPPPAMRPVQAQGLDPVDAGHVHRLAFVPQGGLVDGRGGRFDADGLEQFGQQVDHLLPLFGSRGRQRHARDEVEQVRRRQDLPPVQPAGHCVACGQVDQSHE